ncbi:hypothetical protein LMG7141_00828 [Ralstonia condita]|uniref:Transmembrane protein n=1 Tax=Ralstonia condita TaxID=3058600 RepID=A0ABM9J158_9RALS|nr:hypothetical protein [Ralstonia sp. LMG 7141]CAJ0779009.1 hypothetical protein LMG7141_00828 [Ralstonia sp. LMG 7141]
MTATEAYTWAAIGLAFVMAFIFGFVLLVNKLARNPGNRIHSEQDDERSQRRRC